MNRFRKDHESLGFLALVMGLVWSALLLATGDSGYRLAHGHHGLAVSKPAPAVAPVALPTKPEADAEARVPARALDYAALDSIHPDPVKSPAHGGRWVRAWVSPDAAAAYRAGTPLPEGALVVLSSVEDRWGRPGVEGGPLYALEMKASGPSLMFYWPRIPMDRRREFGGESRVYWRGGDAHLAACRTCHATGMADPSLRSRWRAAKRVDPER